MARFSKGGKAAVVTGVCLLAIAGVGTGLYFGVSSIRSAIDAQVAKAGTVTLKNLWATPSQLTDEQSKFLSVSGDGLIKSAATTDDVTLSSSVKFDLPKNGILAYCTKAVHSDEFDGWLRSSGKPTGFSLDNTNCDGFSLAYYQAKQDYTEQAIDAAFNCAATVEAISFYRVSDLGYVSVAKTKYVFSHLVEDMKTIKGDLTFKKSDVLHYAELYEEDLDSSSSSAGASSSRGGATVAQPSSSQGGN